MAQQRIKYKYTKKKRPRKFTIELTEKACIMLREANRLDRFWRPLKQAEPLGHFISRAVITLLKGRPIDERFRIVSPLQKAEEEKLRLADIRADLQVELQRMKDEFDVLSVMIPKMEVKIEGLLEKQKQANRNWALLKKQYESDEGTADRSEEKA